MPTHVTRTTRINAPPVAVWAVMTDVERWAEWTESVRKITREGSGKFGMGSSAQISLRGAPGTSIWRVTEYEEGRSFAWESKSPGVVSVGNHVIEPDGDGSKVTLSVTQSGIGAILLSPYLSYVNRRNLGWETEGLKRHCEA